jgi:ElaB/YqjD/DUF883 family membrane-anchored ribosome-binding protein
METREERDAQGLNQPSPFESARRRDEAMRIGEESAEEMKGRVNRTLRQAKDKVSDAYERSSDAVGRAYSRAMDYSKENPQTATLVALGAGVGIGLLLGWAMPARSRYPRLLPAVATALADAVLDVFDRRG